jgi:hypothetical protein
MRPDTPLVKAKKAKLIALGYPWPENLNDKSLEWLDTEIRVMTPKPDPQNTPSAHRHRQILTVDEPVEIDRRDHDSWLEEFIERLARVVRDIGGKK